MKYVIVADLTEMIKSLTSAIYGTLTALVIIMAMVFLVAVIYFLIWRRNAKKYAELGINPKINYSTLKRKDASDYIKFEEIVDLTPIGAYVMDGGKTFTAGIELSGFDFLTASDEERYATMINMIQMTNSIDKVQVRQEARPVNLAESIEECERQIEALEEDRRRIKSAVEHIGSIVNPILADKEAMNANIEMLEYYAEEAKKQRKEYEAVNWLIEEQRAIINEYVSHQGDYIAPERITCYMVSWSYNPAEHAARQLTSKEIYAEARRALIDKLVPLRAALERCSVQTKYLSCEDLLQMMRFHYTPYSADKYPLSSVLNSSYFHLFSTADTRELERAANEEQKAREAYEEYMMALDESEAVALESEEGEALEDNGAGALEDKGEPVNVFNKIKESVGEEV